MSASADTLKHRLEAQLAWNALVRGRYKASLEIPDSDVEAALQLHQNQDQSGEKKDVGYEYTMRPIILIVPTGSPSAAYEARKRDADALRARFQNCADGISFARALNDVAFCQSASAPLSASLNPSGAESCGTCCLNT